MPPAVDEQRPPGGGTRRIIIGLQGLTCTESVEQIQSVLRHQPGIIAADVSYTTSRAEIEFDPHRARLADVRATLEGLGYKVLAERIEIPLLVAISEHGALEVESAVRARPGVLAAAAPIGGRRVLVDIAPGQVARQELEDALMAAGVDLDHGDEAGHDGPDHGHGARQAMQTLLGSALLLLGFAAVLAGGARPWLLVRAGFMTLSLSPATLLFLGAIAATGLDVARSAYHSLRALPHTRTLTVSFLATIATLGAILIGEYWEGAVVMVILNVAEMLEEATLARTRTEIESLLALAPRTARVRRDGKLIEVEAGSVRAGEQVVVRTGERIPVDGVVIGGKAEVNEAPVTGESLPRLKEDSSAVFGGTLVEGGYLEVRATRVGEDNTIRRICRMVEKASEWKAPRQRRTDQFAKYFIPAVLVLAAYVGLVQGSVIGALTLLVVACPCALVIATPVSIVSAIGHLARRGILVKGGAPLEGLATVKAVAFDKTGTMTEGRLTVTVVRTFGAAEADVLRAAATAEVRSEHVIGRAILKRAAAADISPGEPGSFSAELGRGVTASVAGSTVVVGNEKFVRSQSTAIEPDQQRAAREAEQAGRMAIFVAKDQRVIGILEVHDALLAGAKEAVDHLKAIGIHPVLITGDVGRTAMTVGRSLGIDDVHAELLPQDKVAKVAELRERFHGPVAMVGDGINDAPALAAADVGIAFGPQSMALTVETAGIAIASDDPMRIAYLIGYAREAGKIISLNLVISGLTALILLGLAAAGLIHLGVGLIGHELSVLVVLGFAMRLATARFPQLPPLRATPMATPSAAPADGHWAGRPPARPFSPMRITSSTSAITVLFAILMVASILFSAAEPLAFGGGPGTPPGPGPGKGVPMIAVTSDPVSLSANAQETQPVEVELTIEEDRLLDVNASIRWTDEGDAGPLFTNAPDSFTVTIRAPWGEEVAASGTNPQGGEGEATVSFPVDSAKYKDALAAGNTTWVLVIECTNAGDQRAVLRTQTDPGNAYTGEATWTSLVPAKQR